MLVFSHGGGEARETYATQLEDLASQVMSGRNHAHVRLGPRGLPGRTPRADGAGPLAATKDERYPRLPPSEEASPDRLRSWADDLRFVLDELTRLNRADVLLRRLRVTSTCPGRARLVIPQAVKLPHTHVRSSRACERV